MDIHTKVCSFCTNKGLPPPHNHTIRNFTKKDVPIICPELLKITCTYCKKKGHTKKHCSLLKQKNALDKITPNLHKRLGVVIDPRRYDETIQRDPKIPKVNILAAAFGAIDIDCENDLLS